MRSLVALSFSRVCRLPAAAACATSLPENPRCSSVKRVCFSSPATHVLRRAFRVPACRTGADHWIASFIVCVTGCALLLAFSLTACSDPGIVYRPAEWIPLPAAEGGGAQVADATSAPSAMEGGGVLCGKARWEDVASPPATMVLPVWGVGLLREF